MFFAGVNRVGSGYWPGYIEVLSQQARSYISGRNKKAERRKIREEEEKISIFGERIGKAKEGNEMKVEED